MKASTINPNKKGIKPDNKGIHPVLVLIFWTAIWWLFSSLLGKPLLLPSPDDVFSRLLTLVITIEFWAHVVGSMVRVLTGLTAAIFIGTLTGVSCAFIKPLEDLFSPLVTAIQATPVLSFILLALIWFGSSIAPIFICFLMCFPVIWISVFRGIKEMDRQLLEMAESFCVPWSRRLSGLYLPGVRPYFVTACLSAFSLGWKVTVAAEVLSFPRTSIGGQLYAAKATLESADLFAWTMVVILMSLCFERLFHMLIIRRRTS